MKLFHLTARGLVSLLELVSQEEGDPADDEQQPASPDDDEDDPAEYVDLQEGA